MRGTRGLGLGGAIVVVAAVTLSGLVGVVPHASAAPPVVISAGDASVVEGSSEPAISLTFAVTLSEPSPTPVSVSYTFVNGTADGADYDSTHGTRVLKFAPVAATGLTTTEKFVSVRIAPDGVTEPMQFLRLQLSAPSGGTLGRAVGFGDIVDDDPGTGATISVGDGAIVEGDAGKRTARFAVTLSAPSTAPVSVAYTLAPISATPVTDFDDVKGKTRVLTIKPKISTGLTVNEKYLSVKVTPDVIGESDEAFTLTLSAPQGGYALGRSVGTGTILDDDTMAWSEVAVGRDHACALATGGVFCWGANPDGELGSGAAADVIAARPVAVVGLATGTTQLAAGANHTCAVVAGGARCWGHNVSGQLGDGTTTSRTTPVGVTGLGSGVAQVSAGQDHSCAVTTAGAVLCWGENGDGQLGDGTTTSSPTPVGVTGLGSGVAEVVAGPQHTCARTSAGAVLCWGENTFGQLGDGTNTSSAVPVAVSGLSSGVARIAAGGHSQGPAGASSCAVTTAGGAALCWGSNALAQLGDGTTTDSSVPVAVSGLGAGVAAVAIGGTLDRATACARTTAGAVHCWGDGTEGQLGDGFGSSSPTPVAVPGLAGVTSLAVGGTNVCAVDTSGRAWCWGSPAFGGLGDDHAGDGLTPSQVVHPIMG